MVYLSYMEASLRRQPLLDEMQKLADNGKHCAACPGHCCTAIANSMQTTPLETLDVLNYLRESGRWSEELKIKLSDTIKKFRLDQIPGNGRKNYLRRTYDCPFFAGSNLGCTIPKEVKPYGCLGFNPSAPREENGDSCSSDQQLLLAREAAWSDEVNENIKLKSNHKLWWDKLPFPMALLELEKAMD
jgi:Fe-S-cluster containining protein